MNTPIIAQIAITLVALMAIYRVFQRYQQGAMPLAEAIGWKVAWLAVAVLLEWFPLACAHPAGGRFLACALLCLDSLMWITFSGYP
jgi:hypothetical protein